jgi:hypothetical protein
MVGLAAKINWQMTDGKALDHAIVHTFPGCYCHHYGGFIAFPTSSSNMTRGIHVQGTCQLNCIECKSKRTNKWHKCKGNLPEHEGRIPKSETDCKKLPSQKCFDFDALQISTVSSPPSGIY